MRDGNAVRYKQHGWVEADKRLISSALVGHFGDSRCLAHVMRFLTHRFAFGALVADAGGADGRSRLIDSRQVVKNSTSTDIVLRQPAR